MHRRYILRRTLAAVRVDESHATREIEPGKLVHIPKGAAISVTGVPDRAGLVLVNWDGLSYSVYADDLGAGEAAAAE